MKLKLPLGVWVAIDVLRNRLPGARAMLKARDVAVSVHHPSNSVVVRFFFDSHADAATAYRTCEKLYDLDFDERAP